MIGGRESVDTIGPLWEFAIAVGLVVLAVVWAEKKNRKDDDVQALIDKRSEAKK